MSAMPQESHGDKDRAPVGLSLPDLLKKRPADRLAVEAHKERLSRLSEAARQEHGGHAMSDKDFRDELVWVIRDQDTALADLGRDQAEAIADAILSSDWLRKHDAQVWDEGYRTSDAAWAETWDLVTPDEDRTDPRNPYRTVGAA